MSEPDYRSQCVNCDDRRCMDCVLRVVHDDCREDCPMCCAPMKAAIDDPAWVLDRYREAKELLDEIRETVPLPTDLRAGVDDFHTTTVMDGCTTFRADCACNRALALPPTQGASS